MDIRQTLNATQILPVGQPQGEPASTSTPDVQRESTPDVRVELSDRARQLATDAQQQQQVQASRSTTESQSAPEVVAPPPSQERPDEAVVASEELTGSNTPVERSLDTLQQAEPAPTQAVAEETTAEEPVAPANPEPANTSQSASVATQYNISPEAALGQSISIRA